MKRPLGASRLASEEVQHRLITILEIITCWGHCFTDNHRQQHTRYACFYLTPEQDDSNKIPELQVCIAEALYDIKSMRADARAYNRAGESVQVIEERGGS